MKSFTLDLPHSDEEVHYRDYRINEHKFAFDRIQYDKGERHNMERIAVPVIRKSDGEPVANLETTVILVECGNIYHYLDNGFAVRLSDAQMVTVANEILKKRAEVRGTGLKTLSGWRESGLPSVEDYLEVGDEVDSEMLDYFGSSSGGNSKRIAYNGSSAAVWWLRSPRTGHTYSIWCVKSDGSDDDWGYYNSYGVRPAFILPSELSVSDDGTVSVNTAPTITNTSGTQLGEKNAAFSYSYTVSDADGDTISVTEKLDGKTVTTRTDIASGTVLTFEQASTEEGFRRILNGSHTIQIVASDGKDSSSASATFTKDVTSASVTLKSPLAVEGDITVAVLQVTGSIPDDATFKAEVTNNANDAEPVWQDATTEVQKGTNIVFSNKTASNGAAFNFRISVSRGASGESGYIEAVTGAFQ